MANTPTMGEDQRIRVRLTPRDAAGNIAYEGSTQATLDLTTQTVRAEITSGASAATLRNPDGSPLAPGGIVAPSRYGEFWVVGRSVQTETEIVVRVTVTGDRIIGGSTTSERTIIVRDTVPDANQAVVARIDIGTSVATLTPPDWQ